MDIPCSLTEGHFGCYQFGTLINKDVRPFCTGFCVDISFHASGINARSAVAKWYGSMFSFLKEVPNYFLD